MFRLSSIFIGFILVITLIIGCSASLMPATWNQWLANLRPNSMKMSSSGKGYGCRAEETKLKYHGDGRAELGEYSIRMFDPLTHITLRAEFTLEGSTDCSSESSFKKFMRYNNRFFREQVNVALRACDPEQLVETDVDTLQRRLVTQVNRSLERDFLSSVKIKDFALYESINKSGFVKIKNEQKGNDVAALP